MPSTVKARQCVWSKVFRVIVARAEADPHLKRALGPKLRSWRGDPDDATPLAPTADGPVVRFTPQPRNVDWYGPSDSAGRLAVLVELAVGSTCVDDVLNLWETIVDALSPFAPGFCDALVAAGAETGEITFSDPAYDPRPDAQPNGVFHAAGVFWLNVVRPITARA